MPTAPDDLINVPTLDVKGGCGSNSDSGSSSEPTGPPPELVRNADTDASYRVAAVDAYVIADITQEPSAEDEAGRRLTRSPLPDAVGRDHSLPLSPASRSSLDPPECESRTQSRDGCFPQGD